MQSNSFFCLFFNSTWKIPKIRPNSNFPLNSFCLGIDIDDEALNLSKDNCEEFEIENIDLLQLNIVGTENMWKKQFDTVIMNPPFGTKNNKGILITRIFFISSDLIEI